METEHQLCSESLTDEDSDMEDSSGNFESCAADSLCHPQLDADIQAVRTLHSDSAISVRKFETIDGVDVDLKIHLRFLDREVAKAWRVNPSEAIIFRLQFSLSQYLDGPPPPVKVFQPSNDNFSLAHQLQNILRLFISREWKHLSNENIVVARRNFWLPVSKYNRYNPAERGRTVSCGMKLSNKRSCTAAHTIKNPKGELLTYAPSGKRVVTSGVKSPAQQPIEPIEPLFSPDAIWDCKTVPLLHHGFLVQVMRYIKQRIMFLNEYCVVCDEKHLFQNGPMLKPAVCTRDLCVYSFNTLGVMKGATEEVASGAEVVDLLVAMCRAAHQSVRQNIIFDPYPIVVDPCNPKVLAISPKTRTDHRLRKVLDSVMLVTRMAQGSYAEIKKQMDEVDPLAHPLLQWILSSNRSHIVKLSQHKQLKFMHTPHQFLLISSPPTKEARFKAARIIHGSTFAFHGSHMENWHSILRKGLINASNTKFQLHGAAFGRGIYLSPFSSISFGYSGMMDRPLYPKPQGERRGTDKEEEPENARFLEGRDLRCIALCEVITSKDLQKHSGIWVCPISDHVCTRFLFVYENFSDGYITCVDTQDTTVQKEISRVIAENSC